MQSKILLACVATSVGLTELRKNKREPFLQTKFQGHYLIQYQPDVSLPVRFSTLLFADHPTNFSFFLCQVFPIVSLLFFFFSFLLLYPFILSFWIPSFPLRNDLEQKYLSHLTAEKPSGNPVAVLLLWRAWGNHCRDGCSRLLRLL